MSFYLLKASPFDQVLLLLQLAISLGICVRLLLYRKRYASHKVSMSVIAWALIVAYGWIAIRILTGQYCGPVDPGEVAASAGVLIAVIRSRGNIARFLIAGSYQGVK